MKEGMSGAILSRLNFPQLQFCHLNMGMIITVCMIVMRLEFIHSCKKLG